MAKLGLVDETTKTLSTVSDAAATMVAADTASAIREAIGLGSAAIANAEDLATATQGGRADTAFGWGDHSAAGYVAAPESTLPALDGASLTRLPTNWGGFAESTVTISNSAAETTVATLTLPANLLGRAGERALLRCYGLLLSNISGQTPNWTLRAKLGGTTIWGDASPTSENANPSLIVIEAEVQRVNDTTALIVGNVRWNFPSSPSEGVGIGEIGSTARRVFDWAADNPVTVDFTAEIVLTFTVELATASASFTWTGLYDLTGSNVTGTYQEAPPLPPPGDTVDWLEDQPALATPTRTSTAPLRAEFPRWDSGSVKNTALIGNANQLRTLDVVCFKPFQDAAIAAAQALNPNLLYLRIWCPTEWQGQTDVSGRTGNGFPFFATGASSDWTLNGGTMFAGHWMYGAYTTLSGAIGSGENIQVTVADATKLKAGRWHVLHGGTFSPAEHVYVSAINGNTVTITTRGYRSTAQAWGSGTRIATHKLGQSSTNTLIWSYNCSTVCPTDGNGNRWIDVAADFIAAVWDTQGNGTPMTANCHGVLFDSDFPYWDDRGLGDGSCDANNDGTLDEGFAAAGTNWWGDGLEELVSNMRTAMDANGDTNALLAVGDSKSDGFAQCNSGQLEAWPDHIYNEGGAYPSLYPIRINEMIAYAKVQDMGAYYPRASLFQTRAASLIDDTTPATAQDNRPVRFTIALGCMFDGGVASFQNGFARAYRYYDEYAVITTPGATYGDAILETDTTAILANRGWLGDPTGQYRRVYNPDDWSDVSPNLVWSSEASEGTWVGSRCSVGSSAVDPYGGSGTCISVTVDAGTYDRNESAVNITGPSEQDVNLVSGQVCTLCFAVKADHMTQVQAVVAGESLGVRGVRTPGDGEWMKHVLVFRPTANRTGKIVFNAGYAAGTFQIDAIRLFKGNANVFRRDFDNGIAIVNASPVQVTVDLGATYQLINGNQDAAVNTGAEVSSVILQPWDGRLLLNAQA